MSPAPANPSPACATSIRYDNLDRLLALRPMIPPNAGSGDGRIAEPPLRDDAFCASDRLANPMQLATAAIATVSNKCLL